MPQDITFKPQKDNRPGPRIAFDIRGFQFVHTHQYQYRYHGLSCPERLWWGQVRRTGSYEFLWSHIWVSNVPVDMNSPLNTPDWADCVAAFPVDYNPMDES